MGRKLVRTVAVPKGSKRPLDIRITFNNLDQGALLTFRKIARESYAVTATQLARQVLIDFVSEYRTFSDNPRAMRIAKFFSEQIKMEV